MTGYSREQLKTKLNKMTGWITISQIADPIMFECCYKRYVFTYIIGCNK